MYINYIAKGVDLVDSQLVAVAATDLQGQIII